ncbi:MAG: MgtC/SapB family protein [Spirochaetales bacterium]|nr:MgtC/SapB family protein [Spirochaetales bacterium]
MVFEHLIFRFAIVLIATLIFGLERQFTHKPIGFGTYIFVALGACALAITSKFLETDNTVALLSAIVTGIGFLGAGALIKTNDKIFGFTSAASIWLFAIFGLVTGLGFWSISVILYLSVWFIVLVDRILEKMHIGNYQRRIVLKSKERLSKQELHVCLGIEKSRSICTSYDDSTKIFTYTFLARSKKRNLSLLHEKLLEVKGVTYFSVE